MLYRNLCDKMTMRENRIIFQTKFFRNLNNLAFRILIGNLRGVFAPPFFVLPQPHLFPDLSQNLLGNGAGAVGAFSEGGVDVGGVGGQSLVALLEGA